MKGLLIGILALAVTLAGCVAPPDVEPGTDESTTTSSTSMTARDQNQTRHEIDLPPEPEFHTESEIQAWDGAAAITVLDVTNDIRGSVYIAPYDGDGWFVEAALVALGPTCTASSAEAGRLHVDVSETAGVLTITGVRDREYGLNPIPQADQWIDFKVYVPAGVSVISAKEKHSPQPSSDGRIFTSGMDLLMCPHTPWGYAVHGMTPDVLDVATDDLDAEVYAVRADVANVRVDNGEARVTSSVFDVAEVRADDGTIKVDDVYADVLMARVDDGVISINNVDADALTVRLDDGSATAKTVRARDITIVNDDGAVTLDDVAADTITATSDDGDLLVSLAENSRTRLTARADRGTITANAPVAGGAYGYDVTAAAEKGTVKVDLPDFETSESDTHKVVGRTSDYAAKTYRSVLDLTSEDGNVNVARSAR